MKAVVFLWVIPCLLLSSQVFAVLDAPPAKETYVRAYENCIVHQERNFTNDWTRHLLRCYAAVGQPENITVFVANDSSDRGRSKNASGSIMFDGYYQTHQEKMIDVMFRVDQGPHYKSSWFTNFKPFNEQEVFEYAAINLFFPGHRYYQNTYVRFLEQFLDAVANGQNLYTTVGDRSITIPLNAPMKSAAAAAVDDFTSRIAYLLP